MNGFNNPTALMNMGGLGGLNGFGMKSISSQVNVGTPENPTQFVALGKVISETITMNTSKSLELVLTGQFTFSNKPEILMTNALANVVISGDVAVNEQVNNTPKRLLLVFDCSENGNTEVSLVLSFGSDKLTFKILKECTYTIIDKMLNFFTLVYKIMIISLILLILVTIYLIYKEGNLNILRGFVQSTYSLFSFKAGKSKEELYGSKNGEKNPLTKQNGSFSEDSPEYLDYKQQRFRQLQKEGNLNPKFFENAPGLIYSKKVKFDYENYGTV